MYKPGAIGARGARRQPPTGADGGSKGDGERSGEGDQPDYAEFAERLYVKVVGILGLE